MQVACSGCGVLKDAYKLERRADGNSKCHTCIRKKKANQPTVRVTRSAAKKVIKKSPK